MADSIGRFSSESHYGCCGSHAKAPGCEDDTPKRAAAQRIAMDAVRNARPHSYDVPESSSFDARGANYEHLNAIRRGADPRNTGS